MSYPFDGVTYLEKMQNNPDFLSEVNAAYYILISKKCQDEHRDVIELSLEEQFSVLGEAFKLCGNDIYINDDYSHFMRDVLDCLLKREYSPWADEEDENEG